MRITPEARLHLTARIRVTPWEISFWEIRHQGTVGVGGRGALLGRTNWLHTYLEDNWQILPSLKLDIGLRYEYNQNVTDVNNNMAVINTFGSGRRVRDRQQQSRPDFPCRIRSALIHSDSVYDVGASRMGSQSASRPSSAIGSQNWVGLEFAGSQNRDPLWLWNLYEPGSLQHYPKRGAELALLLCKDRGQYSGTCDSGIAIRKTFWLLLPTEPSARTT